MDLPTYTRTGQWSVLTSRSKPWKTRRYWTHILRQHTWEGLTYTVKPLAGRWPFSQKLIGRHTRRHTCKGVCRRGISTCCRSELTSTKKRKWSYHTVVESARVLLGRRLKYRTVCFLPLSLLLECDPFLPVSCLARLPICGWEERPDHVEVSEHKPQIGWKRTHVFNKYSPQIVRSLAEQSLPSPQTRNRLISHAHC